MASEEVRQAWERGVDARLEQLDELLRAAALDAAPASPSSPSGAGDDEFEPMFENVGEWVEIYFATTFSRHVSQSVRWCSSWWDHPEAYVRLEALWRSWEVHRLDAQRGMAVWFRNFLDGQLVTLFSAEGPFGDCTVSEHNERDPLPLTTAPEGWFTGPE